MLPKRPRGGILTDEIGLGKTIKVITTIVYNPPFIGDVEDKISFGKTIKVIITIVYNSPFAKDIEAKRTVIFIMVLINMVG